MKDIDLVFEDLIYQGITKLKMFSDNEKSSIQDLKEASKLFSNAIKINKKNPTPYFYLSYIFCLFEEKNLATKYLNILEKIDPNFSNIDTLKNSIKKLNHIKVSQNSNFLTKESYNYITTDSLK